MSQCIHICLPLFCNFSISVPLSSHPLSLSPTPCSSLITTFKISLMFLHDGKAIWQWHIASLCVNPTGNVSCEAFFFLMGSLLDRKRILPIYCKETSKLSFTNVQDDGTMRAWVYMCVCECVYLSLIGRENEGLTIETLWILFRWHRNGMNWDNTVTECSSADSNGRLI